MSTESANKVTPSKTAQKQKLISEMVSRKLGHAGPVDCISETPSRNSAGPDWVLGVLHAGLSWSHYQALLRIGRSEARAFDEIEASPKKTKGET